MTLRSAWVVTIALGAVFVGLGAAAPQRATAVRGGSGTVTLIHIGDVHGHLVPRRDATRGDDRRVGGLARLATVVERVRREHHGRTLLVNVGDAVQGSAEALFSQGRAIVDVLALLRIDAFVPGNWDYVYGIDRFVETFVGTRERRPLAAWPSIASNLYYATPDAGMRTAYVDVTGERVLPPYLVRDVGGVRVGIIGITTTRGPRALGRESTRGFMFTAGDAELRSLVMRLRERERADVVVLASELELANNVRLAEHTPGIDVVLSADMHELTREPIVLANGTVLVEEGQDGVAVGELSLTVRDGKVARWAWRLHEVTDSVPENGTVARAVNRVRRPYLARSFERGRVNPLNGAALEAPIDQVVGYTSVALHRANPSSHPVPAVLEGSSHNLVADALRAATGADIAFVRGFRFGTHVPAGPVTREDLYQLLAIGAQVARVDSVPGRVIWRQLEAALAGVLDPDPRQWTGGWMLAASGLELDIDPYGHAGDRVREVRVGGAPLDTTDGGRYALAGLWFPSESNAISNCVPCATAGKELSIVRARSGSVDAVDIVTDYLASRRDSTVSPRVGRVRLLRPLPPALHGFAELQPLAGAGVRKTDAGQTPPRTRH